MALLSPAGQEQLAEFGTVLKEAEDKLNTDRKLADSVAKAGNVVLPMLFRQGEPLGKPDKTCPTSSVRMRCRCPGRWPCPGAGRQRRRARVAATRRSAACDRPPELARPTSTAPCAPEPLVIGYFDQYYPSLSLLIAAKSLNLSAGDIKVRLGERVSLGRLNIGTDPELQMYTYFYKDRDGQPAFPVDSFYDVYSGKIPAEKYRDKIVLIGATAVGRGQRLRHAGVDGACAAGAACCAHSVSSASCRSISSSRRPGASGCETLVFLLVAAYLIVLLPRLKAGMARSRHRWLCWRLLVGAHFVLMTTQLHVDAADGCRACCCWSAISR